MTPRDFAYWLQGYFEISRTDELSKEQVQEIKNHLQLVFKKETPIISGEILGDIRRPDYTNWKDLSKILQDTKPFEDLEPSC